MKIFGASPSKFEVTSRNTPRKHYKYRFRSVLAKESRTYPRDVVAGVATKRGPALLLAARSGFARLGTTRLRTCSQGRRHLIATSYARPAGRSRPPSASVLRRNYFPRALQRTEFIIYRICPRPPAACRKPRAVAGLLLLMLNGIYAGGHDRQNTTPASAAAAAAVVFSVNYLSPPAGKQRPRTAIR